jgi:glucose dehydrogenase
MASTRRRAARTDPFDYDAVQTPVLATIDVGGSARKVVIQANRSGFLYVLDAKEGTPVGWFCRLGSPPRIA